MNLFLALVVGVLSYFVAHLVFNTVISALIALVIAIIIASPTLQATFRR